MAFSTVAIGVLPTYNIGRYAGGLAAPILLALLRLLQGLAMGGEFGSAIIYISELANPGKRGFFVALLQSCVNIGMILATLLVMLLQNTLSEREWARLWGGLNDGAGRCLSGKAASARGHEWRGLCGRSKQRRPSGWAADHRRPLPAPPLPPAAEAMLEWGWRVPFLCAFATALLGAGLRRGMPEPHAFLEAARAASKARLDREGGAADEDGADMDIEVASSGDSTNKVRPRAGWN
jgi:MFS family permease